MSHAENRLRMIAFIAAAGLAALWTTGCGNDKELKSLKEQNQLLTQRVDELEGQFNEPQPAPAEPDLSATNVKELKGQSLYIVVEGDSLWSIAKKKLGTGTRYKEILALNPHIKKDEPLTIGTVLKLPPPQM